MSLKKQVKEMKRVETLPFFFQVHGPTWKAWMSVGWSVILMLEI